MHDAVIEIRFNKINHLLTIKTEILKASAKLNKQGIDAKLKLIKCEGELEHEIK